jgi:hypothetical protein
VIRRTTKFVFEALGTIVAGAAIVAAVGVWQFSSGPISLDFLTPYIETALAAPGGNLRVKLEGTRLAWEGWRRTVDIRATRLRAYDDKGRLVAMVPEIALSLSARALMLGMVAPSSIEIMGAQVHLRRDKDGRIELEFAVPEAPPQNPATPAQATAANSPMDVLPLLAQQLLLPPDASNPTGYLRRVSISDAALVVDDSHWDTAWKARLRELVLQRDTAGIKANGKVDIVVQNATAHVEASGIYMAATKAIALDIDFNDLRPALFARAAPALAPLARLNLPLDGTLALNLEPSGEFGRLRFQVMGGPGLVSIPELYPQDTEIHHFEASGEFTEGGNRLALEAAELDLGGPVITLAGGASGLDGDSRVSLELGLKNLPVDDLPRRWPVSVAPNPRAWMVANLSGGQVDELHLAATMHGHALDPARFALDKLQGTMKVGGVNVHYLGKMPRVRKTGGDIVFDEKTFTIRLDRGVAEGMTVESANIVISGLDLADQMLAVDLVLRGPLRSALQLIDYEPLGYASALGVEPGRIGGQAAVRLLLQYPLLKTAGFAQVQVSAAANMTDVTLANAFLGHDLDKADLKLRVDKTGMDLTGQGRVGPVPVTLAWREGFGPMLERRIELKGELDDAARRNLGLDAVPFLSGPVPATLVLGASEHKTSHVEITLDLSNAAVALPWFYWKKAPGAPGKAHFRLELKNDRVVSINSFEIEAGDLKTHGSVGFAPGSGAPVLRAIEFGALDFGFNRLAGSLALRPGGGYDIELGGESFDAAPFMKGKSEPAATDKTATQPAPPPQKGPPLSISLDVGKLWLTPGHRQPMLAAKGTIEDDGERISKASLTAYSYEGTAVTCDMTPEGTGRTLTIASKDAGALLMTLGVLDNVVGGKLDLRADIDDAAPGAPIKGVFRMEDYELTRTPFLAKLLTLASLTGIGDRLNGQGISMQMLNVPFTKLGDRITVAEGRTVGSELGLTFDGSIDLGAQTIDLRGTIVPVYTLNSLLGNIPGVGHLLVGSPGSGIFAPSYHLSGSLDDPSMSVNALSALTPGILRGIFGSLGGKPAMEPAPEQAETPAARP